MSSPEPSPAPSSGSTSAALLPATLPSVDRASLTLGTTHTYHSPIPARIAASPTTPVILGVDEAGRGPVLGPMVYAVAYCLATDAPLLTSHNFDDSKKLTPAFRASLMATLTAAASPLHAALGWATQALSAKDISAGMLRGAAAYNLNAQALDATVALIAGVLERGVNVAEVYVDTVGPPAAYQARLQKRFPTVRVTVSKKADSLYPIVSAASVCAKVTRDEALEVLVGGGEGAEAAGSGYPGDEKTKRWLRGEMDSVFGWRAEVVRFSWSTARDMLEGAPGGKRAGGGKGLGVEVEWPEDLEEGERGIASFLGEGGAKGVKGWYGMSVGDEMDF
ncbi:ribonuclease HII-domain-containing protein [Morchella snyderi]|nr:ribonuclease HII-domain-containing protein [Morchella snyderi]